MRAYTDDEVLNQYLSHTVTAAGPIAPNGVSTWHATPVEAAPAAPAPSPLGRLGRLGLTERELDVADLATAGYSYAQIARKLFVAPTTVGYHLSNIYAKCGVRSRHELTELVRSQPSMAGRF